MRPRTILQLAVLASALAAGPALAEPSPAEIAATKKAAVELANKAFGAFKKEQYAEALAGFEDAERTFHSPTFLLYVARTQIKLGRLVAAKGTYERIVEERLATYAPQEFFNAQQDAKAELKELAPRLASLTLKAGGGISSLTLDGRPVQAGESIAVDPGEHSMAGSGDGEAVVERKVTLAEGESRTETLEPPSAGSASATGPSGGGLGHGVGPLRLPVLSYVAYGVGAAGLVVGGVFGGLTLAVKGDYDAARKAEPLDAMKVNAAARQGRAFAAAADAGFAVAILGAAAGTIVWVVSRGTPPAGKAGASVFITPGVGAWAIGGTF